MLDRSRVCSVLMVVALPSCGPQDDTAQIEQGLMICPTTTVEGVDVYDGDGTITWSSVASTGRRFAIIKASQGDYNTQTKFRANWADTRAAGMLRSPYHFFDATIDGVTQANHFLSVLADAGGLQPGDLPPMLDAECPTSSVEASAEASCEYSGNSGWAPSATISQRMFDWLHTVEAATGRKAMIYSYVSWFGSVGVTDAALADYPLYIASYNTCATIPAPWTTAVFWQYSDTGSVTGIGTGVDLDRFIGSEAELLAFANGDAGSVMMPSDGGTMTQPDAGAEDAGMSTPPDAGDAQADAGDGAMTGGCGCGASGAGPLVLLLAALLRRVRAARIVPMPCRRSA